MHIIEKMMPFIEKFSRETFLERLETKEVSLNKSREFLGVETTFSALSVCPCLSRSASTSGEYESRSRS